MNSVRSERRNVVAIVIVAALGYFVDIYDLILFSIVRISSLKSLGFLGDSILSNGVLLLNMQMVGMLLGGILWGILGDKRGRISVLFGSIILYSIANIANGFVQNIEQYSVFRLIAGIGLAGELGAGITLVSEVMSKESRGYGTMLVATIGILGAVAAALIGDFFEWRIAFFVGGGLGLILLILRIGVYESGMFSMIRSENIKKGLFHELFTEKKRFLKYIKCIFIGVPIWFVVGILITFSPEFARALGVKETISAGSAVMYCYIGLALGDFTSGSLSQLIRSRKRVVFIYLVIMTFFIGVYLFFNHFNSFYFYTLCLLLGFGSGYWAIFVTIASEQFGTNLRATVTTTVPNFVRGGVVPMTIAFEFVSGHTGIIYGGLIIAVAALIIAYVSAFNLEETYGKDLNYIEML
jgi:putative MFS transporter